MASPNQQLLRGDAYLGVENTMSYPDYTRLVHLAGQIGVQLSTTPGLLDSIPFEPLSFHDKVAGHYVGYEHLEHFNDLTGFTDGPHLSALFGNLIDPDRKARSLQATICQNSVRTPQFSVLLDRLIDWFPLPEDQSILRRSALGQPPHLTQEKRDKLTRANQNSASSFYKEFTISARSLIAVHGKRPLSSNTNDLLLFGFTEQLQRQGNS